MWRLSCLTGLLSLSMVIASCKRESGMEAGDRPHSLEISCLLEIALVRDDVLANLTFTNRGSMPLELEEWLLVKSEMDWEAFEVMRGDERIEYLCKTGTRSARNEKKVVLEPGEKYKSQTVLSACYDVTRPGKYSVVYRGYPYIKETKEIYAIVSNAASFVVE